MAGMISFLSQTWLPVVMQSTPICWNSRKMSGVMPKPPAAFSTFAMQ